MSAFFKVFFQPLDTLARHRFSGFFYMKAYRQESTVPAGSAICHWSVNEQQCEGAINQTKQKEERGIHRSGCVAATQSLEISLVLISKVISVKAALVRDICTAVSSWGVLVWVGFFSKSCFPQWPWCKNKLKLKSVYRELDKHSIIMAPLLKLAPSVY